MDNKIIQENCTLYQKITELSLSEKSISGQHQPNPRSIWKGGCYPVNPTRSRGMSRSSLPCLRKTFPAVWEGLIPIPSNKTGFNRSQDWHTLTYDFKLTTTEWKCYLTVCNDSTSCRWYFKLIGGKFQHSCERSCFRNI